MPVPCKAHCRHQGDGQCKLDDERVRGSEVEFADELDPANNCECFVPREAKKKKRKKR